MTPASAAEAADVRGLSVLVIGAGYAGVMATNRLLAPCAAWKLIEFASRW